MSRRSLNVYQRKRRLAARLERWLHRRMQAVLGYLAAVVDGVRIADDGDCYVIAEIGHNHQCNIETCKDLMRTAKECGASADFLADLDMPAYKIALGDLTNIPLVKYVAEIGKPMFISTGGATMDDVARAYDAVTPINGRVCLMQCTSGYPADYDKLNLDVIRTYRDAFADAVIGYFGHDNGIAMPLVAYMLGARAVEKHFTLNRASKGTDHAFSLAPDGLRRMVRDLRRARVALGSPEKRRLDVEDGPMFKMKKKLVAARDLPSGHVLTRGDVGIKSPGDGLPPYELDNVLGKATLVALREDDNLRFEDLVSR